MSASSLLLHPGDLEAQVVQGHLTDARTKFAVNGANVALRDSTGTVVATATTNYLGAFRIGAPGPGTYSLVAGTMAYRSEESGSFDLAAGETATVDLRLSPEPFELDTLRVESRRQRIDAQLRGLGFYDRQRSGAGSYLTPEQIRRWPAVDVVDILAHAPFVTYEKSMSGTTVYVSKYRRCQPTIYVDDRKLQRTSEVEYAADPEDIVGVEVYRGTTQIPLQYAGNENCGVILIWTKFGGR